MTKKIIILMISLLSAFSIAFAYDYIQSTMNATTVSYTSGKFTYDLIGEEYQPQTNIDTNQDRRPDINLDFDND